MFSLKFHPPSLLVVFIVVLCHLHPNEGSNAPQKCFPSFFNNTEELFKEFSNEQTVFQTNAGDFAKAEDVDDSNENSPDLSIIRQIDLEPLNQRKEFAQLPFETVTNKLIQKFNLTTTSIDSCQGELKEGEFFQKALNECLAVSFFGPCDFITPYRTADGTCNNLLNPRWGSSGACFQRFLPPSYEKGSGLRKSIDGGPLPKPRVLSLNIHSHLNRPAVDVSHMYTFFGQLIDHDLTQAPISRSLRGGSRIECCDTNEPLDPQCAPILISKDDPFYSQFNVSCLNFVRSSICDNCQLGSRNQINEIASFLDASFVYGNNLVLTFQLRENDWRSGRMKVQTTPFGDLLPDTTDNCPGAVKPTDKCFVTGDGRANQHTPLISLQTIFVREHNRLADKLTKMHRLWSGEKIFQEARRIVGAEMQVITYKEYLPITLGDERMDHYDLKLKEGIGRTSYENDTNPTIHNEFSAAAFRFGHSLVNSLVAEVNGQSRLLRDEFFQPFDIAKGILSPLMVGVTQCPSQKFDHYVVPDLTNFLYMIKSLNETFGLDLASINIQRGRDHGIAPYIDVVHFCNPGITITDFQDLVSNNLVNDENVRLLSQNYKFVDDIDLWTGMLSERPLSGAIVGPTTACIIGPTFSNLKFGDRFYLEHKRTAFTRGAFTQGQIQELKKMTLSQLICLNTNGTISSLSKNALLLPSDDNPVIKCSEVTGIDIEHQW